MSDVVEIEYNGIPKLDNLVSHLTSKAVAKATLDIEAEAKKSMAGPKSARTYKRGAGSSKKKRVHVTSAPGEAPTSDDGDLAASFTTYMEDEFTGVVKVTSDHAAVMETGGVKAAARPYLRPAVKKVEPGFVEAMEKIVDAGSH